MKLVVVIATVAIEVNVETDMAGLSLSLMEDVLGRMAGMRVNKCEEFQNKAARVSDMKSSAHVKEGSLYNGGSPLNAHTDKYRCENRWT